MLRATPLRYRGGRVIITGIEFPERTNTAKKLLLLLAAVLLFTTATVPSFADGDPVPHGASCPITGRR
jgi:hypothetical protein